ncbi:MAG: DUF4845 domain-containing protein [Paucibacter sp.]|nr:DUF4845 domain-containing protein [Roseateles sp.]
MPGSFSHRSSRRRQSGISLVGLLFWAIVLAFAALLVMRVAPTLIEYYTLKRVIGKIVIDNPGTVPAVRADFDRARQVEYSIESVNSQDLVVTKDNDQLVISFAYDKQVPLFGPVSLMIHYEASTH